jgi:hypothetical protein
LPFSPDTGEGRERRHEHEEALKAYAREKEEYELRHAAWKEQYKANTKKGKRLTWNTEGGAVYQVQYTTNFLRWDNVGEPRTAAASSDSTPVNEADGAGFYRVIRVQ